MTSTGPLPRNEASRHVTAERPEKILHAVGHALDDFPHFEPDHNLGGMMAFERGRNPRCLRQHGDFLPVTVGSVPFAAGPLGLVLSGSAAPSAREARATAKKEPSRRTCE